MFVEDFKNMVNRLFQNKRIHFHVFFLLKHKLFMFQKSILKINQTKYEA